MAAAHATVPGERISRSITAEELAKHASAADCWVAVYGKVLDVTRFVKSHPGGAKVLLKEAGKDCTNIFASTGHSIRALKMFEKMQIGVLEGYTGPPQPKHDFGCVIQ